MAKIFNTEFEVSMRILILLNVFKNGLDLDRIIYYDFFTIYSKYYDLGDENINGNSDFINLELGIQPILFQNAIKELVLNRLIAVETTADGFIYKINDDGVLLCTKMQSDYSKEYLNNAIHVMHNLGDYSIKQLCEYAKEKEEKNNGNN